MELTKHTPGPWTIEDPMEGEWWVVQANLPSHAWRTIATIPQGDLEEGFPQEVVQANSRLIAAAPEMLEALKALRVNACQLGDFMYGAVRECSQDMIRCIDAAIAKAEER